MPAIGGSIESVSFDGRSFAVAADAALKMKYRRTVMEPRVF